MTFMSAALCTGRARSARSAKEQDRRTSLKLV
jgi:hypothetical protein